MSEQHRIDVNTVVGVTNTAPGVYRSHCTCGWSSQQMRSRALAEGEGDDHLTYMTSAPQPQAVGGERSET